MDIKRKEAVMKKFLTDKEWNAVAKVVYRSKLDSWFYLRRGKSYDYVHDTDNGVKIGLKRALRDVNESLDDYNLSVLNLPNDVVAEYKSVLRQYGIS